MEARTIGGLKLIRLVGKGAMSEVFEAENPRLGSRHAVKLYAYPKEDQDVRRRFEVEGRLLAKLDHPRIVKVTDIGMDEASGRPYFVMNLVSDANGKVVSLADIPSGEVDEMMVGRWYDDIRDGLAYIHGKGVVHRDLKLQNVLLGPDGHAVLTDFGISRIVEMPDGERSVVDPAQTIVRLQDGKCPVMGSIGYMAPELEMGGAASPQSDWYALGVMTFKLLTGIWCDSRTDVVAALSTYDPAWTRILPLLLHANPQGRECRSFFEERERCREEAESAAEEGLLMERRRGRLVRHVASCLAVVVSVLALGGGIWMARPSLPSFDSVFKVPDDAPEDPDDDVPSRDEYRSAMFDALVLTHDIFEELRAGVITKEKVKAELKSLSARAKDEDANLFSGKLEGFSSSCADNQALAILLQNASDRIK
jgi:serine/threonine protein kinase